MRKYLVAVGAAALCCIGGIAAADGLPDRAYGRLAPSGYSWSGVYFGGHVGYGWDDVSLSESLSLTIGGLQPPGFPLTSSHSVDGWLGGVHLGAMKQFGALVVGAELSLSGANLEGSGSNCLGITTLVPGIASTCTTNVNWLSTALARVGYAFDRVLAYGTVGWAVAGVDHRLSLNVPLGAGLGLNWAQQDVADGVAYGGGFEYAIAPDIMLGVQYLHVNLESRGEGLLLGGVLTHGSRDVELNTVTARLSFKWGGNCCAAAPLK
jgi:outer membrane immunogenic protein